MAVSSANAQSEVNYSDQWADDSVEDTIQAVGVGITEADYNTDADSYTVQTNLEKPTGERVSVTADGYTSTRAEIALFWNLDWGTWLTTSFHRGRYTQCFWDDFYGMERCRSYSLLLASTNDNASYTDNNTDVSLLYRKDGQRLRADYCKYIICPWMEDSECAYGRKAPSVPFEGSNPDGCPAGLERNYKVVGFSGFRVICWRKTQEFLSHNPC